MRLRIVVPRRRARAGLGGLAGPARGLAPLVTGLALLAGCGEASHDTQPTVRSAPPTAGQTPAPTPARAVIAGRRGRELAIGLTEANPNLLALLSVSAASAGEAAFRHGRELVAELHPDFVRLEIDWSKLSPAPGRAPTLAQPASGCDRDVGPCAQYAGVEAALRAIAVRRRSDPGFEPVVVIDGVPAWAAGPAGGCERPGTQPRSRPIAVAAVADYRRLIASLITLGQREGVELHWWSPWNEPNHPYTISPQRERCDVRAPASSPGVYATLARAMRDELRAAGGDRRLVLGELAGYVKQPGPRATGVAEFVADLPQDVICAGSVWALHDYGARYGDPAAALAPVSELERALDRRGACGRAARIWITETGAGGPNPRAAPSDRAAACRRLAAALGAWTRDPRVDAAFQYTFREDPAFPVGLTDARLEKVFPAYYEWRAWGARRPADPSPPLAPECAL